MKLIDTGRGTTKVEGGPINGTTFVVAVENDGPTEKKWQRVETMSVDDREHDTKIYAWSDMQLRGEYEHSNPRGKLVEYFAGEAMARWIETRNLPTTLTTRNVLGIGGLRPGRSLGRSLGSRRVRGWPDGKWTDVEPEHWRISKTLFRDWRGRRRGTTRPGATCPGALACLALALTAFERTTSPQMKLCEDLSEFRGLEWYEAIPKVRAVRLRASAAQAAKRTGVHEIRNVTVEIVANGPDRGGEPRNARLKSPLWLCDKRTLLVERGAKIDNDQVMELMVAVLYEQERTESDSKDAIHAQARRAMVELLEGQDDEVALNNITAAMREQVAEMIPEGTRLELTLKRDGQPEQ